ncbi:hypothetical protein OC844_002081 [Tilletia horrida]|nr:hypothetical protein OC844_002081 [Tilletia horrida]
MASNSLHVAVLTMSALSITASAHAANPASATPLVWAIEQKDDLSAPTGTVATELSGDLPGMVRAASSVRNDWQPALIRGSHYTSGFGDQVRSSGHWAVTRDNTSGIVDLSLVHSTWLSTSATLSTVGGNGTVTISGQNAIDCAKSSTGTEWTCTMAGQA